MRRRSRKWSFRKTKTFESTSTSRAICGKTSSNPQLRSINSKYSLCSNIESEPQTVVGGTTHLLLGPIEDLLRCAPHHPRVLLATQHCVRLACSGRFDDRLYNKFVLEHRIYFGTIGNPCMY